MNQTKLILDTNSYLRLAQNIHPLLCKPFGSRKYTLYMHAELNAEFRSSPRLQTKFQWAADKEFVDNRRRSLNMSKEQKREIKFTYEYMWADVKERFHRQRQKGPTPIDTGIICTAMVLGIPVVTDDQDMVELAQSYDVEVWSTLKVLKLMLDEAFITQDTVEQVVAQWRYDNDTPSKYWESHYRLIFGISPPA